MCCTSTGTVLPAPPLSAPLRHTVLVPPSPLGLPRNRRTVLYAKSGMIPIPDNKGLFGKYLLVAWNVRDI